MVRLTFNAKLFLFLLTASFGICTAYFENLYCLVLGIGCVIFLIFPNNVLKLFGYKTEIDDDMGPPLNKVFQVMTKDDNGNVLVVKSYDHTFIGVGDIINHYTNSKVKIISIKVKGEDDSRIIVNDLLYHYLPLTYTWGDREEKVDKEEALRWTKHEAAFSNINNIVEESENTKSVKKFWWDVENRRRAELPRFFVKLLYPKSEYKVGDIVECFDSQYRYDEQKFILCSSYPDIFEPVTDKLATAAKIGLFDE